MLSGCDRIRGIVRTDEMVTPPDETTMPTLKVGGIRPHPFYFSFSEGADIGSDGWDDPLQECWGLPDC